jgi:two-component system response regulator ResD
MKVLLADDEPDQLMLRTMLLENCGFEAIAAETCERALDLAIEHQPQCAVIDLRLPTENDGLTLISRLHSDHPDISIFVLTGGRQTQLAGLLESGVVKGVFWKGASAPELLGKLKAVAQGRG